MQFVALSALVACAAAYPRPDGPPPPVYGPAPPAYKPAPAYTPAPAPYGKPEEKLPPQPYTYEYGVKDEYTGMIIKD